MVVVSRPKGRLFNARFPTVTETAQIKRLPDSIHGTLGMLFVDGRQMAWTLELPDRDNRPNYSRIPDGIYECRWRRSPRFGWTYHITDVPGRTWILAHSGNLAGDREQGMLAHTYGCVLMGLRVGALDRQLAVLQSKSAVQAFNDYWRGETFILEVTSV